ncbi:MAG: class I SAM-dependent methyltransferase [Mesorhizobium sp.]|uniref:class I SAM-dependent methyltransferase n=1 Tax=Mesorhizobium sp. TaxID=1871066 RepID=UPI001AC3B501|nr:class I SAM-dependent methyltransferase [Mesorhizobium sp.]
MTSVWDEFYQNTSFGSPCVHYQWIIHLFANRPRILDVGCGNGRNTLPLIPIASEIVAIDSSKIAIEQYRGRLGGASNVTLIHADALTLFDLHLGSFDLVLCHGLLHLLPRGSQHSFVRLIQGLTGHRGVNVVVAIDQCDPAPASSLTASYSRIPFSEVEIEYQRWECLFHDRTVFEPTVFLPNRRSTHRSIWRKL